jgi:hypothetical protein
MYKGSPQKLKSELVPQSWSKPITEKMVQLKCRANKRAKRKREKTREKEGWQHHGWDQESTAKEKEKRWRNQHRETRREKRRTIWMETSERVDCDNVAGA